MNAGSGQTKVSEDRNLFGERADGTFRIQTALDRAWECLYHFLMVNSFLNWLIGNKLTPLSVFRSVVAFVSCPVLLGYAFVILFATIGGIGLAAATVSYFGDAFVALTPLLVIISGYWLLYLYLHSVIVSVADSAILANALVYLTFQAVWTIVSSFGTRVSLGLASFNVAFYLPWHILRSVRLRLLAKRGLPGHLATGWTAASCPQVLYE